MLAEAVHGCFYAGDTPAMLAAAARAVALAAVAGHAPRDASSRRWRRASRSSRTGRARPAPRRGPQRRRDPRGVTTSCADDPRLLDVVGARARCGCARPSAGRGLVDRAFERARERGGGRQSCRRCCTILARDQATTDRWAAAEASYDEAIRLARETGQRTELAAALAGLAWLQARQGREDACRRHADQAATLCAELGDGPLRGLDDPGARAISSSASAGRTRPTVHHEAQAAALRSRGIADVDLSPAPELVDAYLRLGRGDEAAAAGRRSSWPRPRPRGSRGRSRARRAAAGCSPTAAGSSRVRGRAARCTRGHPTASRPARTRLAYGARLRRARQRVRAREQLRAAVELFERLGAEPWADQARAELAATGETARRRDVEHARRPHAAGAADRAAAGRRQDDARGGRGASSSARRRSSTTSATSTASSGIRSREELAASFGEPG